MNKKILLLIITLLISSSNTLVYSQKITKAPDNWFNLDYKIDKVHGVSTEKTYQKLTKKYTPDTIIVAVIDGGVDISHVDLKSVLWINPKEIPNNNIDDDKNGYVDDVYGWNFLGGKNGESVNFETLELTRLYAPLEEKYRHGVDNPNDDDYQYYLSLKKSYNKELIKTQDTYAKYKSFYKQLEEIVVALQSSLGDSYPLTVENLTMINTTDTALNIVCHNVANLLESSGKDDLNDFMKSLNKAVIQYKGLLDYGLNPTCNERRIVGDNPNDMSELYYGNNDVTGPDANHGTHVAGIIAADRTNNTGIKGVSSTAKVMSVRAVPNGDERDKDVANAIRYAVDNGAKIINMSFGKGYSYDKAVVDSAVKYAASKDVLLVHAAGNDAQNNDITANFPNKYYTGGGTAPNWIEVGALSWQGGLYLVAPFSNYGKYSVDVFAPGVDIYSTVPFSEYESNSGTSMAAPVVTGIACVIRSYFPQLTAEQVKDIILKSAVKIKHYVYLPISNDEESKTDEEIKVKFSELSVTGGVVNLYDAFKLAEKTKPLSK